MAEPVSIARKMPEQTAQEPQNKPWKRLDGEKVMWHNRFLRYLALGPKRTLQAAVEQERATITALKSTDMPSLPKTKKGRHRSESVSLQEVPKQPRIQVPGSWKSASKQ